ncbi:MAG: ABC transporter ATP-binding protein [bacterium]
MISVSLHDVTKRYGALTALDRVSLEIRPGEIHAILGENGAGKTTLMRVLCGLASPDSGEVLVDGAPVAIRSPRDAVRLGVGMVHQHQLLAPRLSVAENLLLAMRSERGFFIRRARMRQIARGLSERFGLGLDPDAIVSSLPVGVAQRVEILKALSNDAKLLILDEPTAVLAPGEIDGLLGIMRRLAEAGAAVLFVTHKLGEVRLAASRVTVMRHGRVALELRLGSGADFGAVARAVVGAANSEVRADARTAADAAHEVRAAVRAATAAATDAREVLLAARGVSVARDTDESAPSGATPLVLDDASFELHAGEILGIAGVDGNGQAELALAAAGIDRPARGSVTAAGCAAFVPGDRTREGLIAEMSILENLSIGPHRERAHRARGVAGRAGVLDLASLRALAARALAAHDIRATGIDQRAGDLSGGNQQKVVLARELGSGARVVIVVNPTRGLDIGATRFVHDTLRAHRDRGGGVLLISSDLDEVLALADRVGVLFRGRLRILAPGEATLARVGEMMVGAGEGEATAGAAARSVFPRPGHAR